MADKLLQIAEKRKEDVRKLLSATTLADLRSQAEATDAPLCLLAALEATVLSGVVASEFKRASPSKGAIGMELPLAGENQQQCALGVRALHAMPVSDIT